MNSNINKLDSKESRLRFLRSLSGLTRKEVEIKYKMPEITLRKWETGQSPLTSKGLDRCIAIYNTEGISVNRSWLDEGLGPFPGFIEQFARQSFNINADLEYFKKSYRGCIIYQVENENMLPQYKPKDFVIGFVHNGEIEELNGKDCIARLNTNETIFGKIFINNSKTINLMYTNHLKSNYQILFDLRVQFIAPVVWHKINY